MTLPPAPKLVFPLDSYLVNGAPFGKRAAHDGVFWGVHLGEDCVVPAGTDVRAIGRGKVVYAALHPGTADKGNWGHIVIIAHRRPRTKEIFHSLYAHLGTSFKRIGETVECGEPLGFIGEAFTLENGFWEAHLHFAVYVGPWSDEVLPGYWKEGEVRTRPEWWRVPSEFITEYQRKSK
ncbi:MAG: M23 family metallopeptidase [Candidatus Moranbacteria bacterium]|nr:M23 family metallopeptidase [Candidatus Moranbacteria bacterium]